MLPPHTPTRLPLSSIFVCPGPGHGDVSGFTLASYANPYDPTVFGWPVARLTALSSRFSSPNTPGVRSIDGLVDTRPNFRNSSSRLAISRQSVGEPPKNVSTAYPPSEAGNRFIPQAGLISDADNPRFDLDTNTSVGLAVFMNGDDSVTWLFQTRARFPWAFRLISPSASLIVNEIIGTYSVPSAASCGGKSRSIHTPS